MTEAKQSMNTWEILNDARDSRLTKGAQQSLLYHLIMRSDPKKQYSCFPAYELLCLDTGLDMTTLKRAARELERKELVIRQVRPNRSNVWYINVAKLQEVAAADRASRKEAKLEAGVQSPFAAPVIVSTAKTNGGGAVSAEADTVEFPTRRSSAEQEKVDAILLLLRETFSNHPTYAEPNAEAIMGACVQACIQQSTDAGHCLRVMQLTINDGGEDLRRTIEASSRLGGYIQRSFSGWVQDYDTRRDAEMSAELAAACRGIDTEPLPPGCSFLRNFHTYLTEQLGEHLVCIDEVVDVDGKVRLAPEITHAAKIAHLLTHETGRVVSPNAVPDFADACTVEQVCLALDDERWADEIRAAEEPLAYFVERWAEIAAAMEDFVEDGELFEAA
jgi:hypothetical protein